MMLKMIDRAVNTYFGVCVYFRKISFDVAIILPLFPTLSSIAVTCPRNIPTAFQPQNSSGKMTTIQGSRGDYRSNVTIKDMESRLHIITTRRAHSLCLRKNQSASLPGLEIELLANHRGADLCRRRTLEAPETSASF
jgi:hypothetical protein